MKVKTGLTPSPVKLQESDKKSPKIDKDQFPKILLLFDFIGTMTTRSPTLLGKMVKPNLVTEMNYVYHSTHLMKLLKYAIDKDPERVKMAFVSTVSRAQALQVVQSCFRHKLLREHTSQVLGIFDRNYCKPDDQRGEEFMQIDLDRILEKLSNEFKKENVLILSADPYFTREVSANQVIISSFCAHTCEDTGPQQAELVEHLKVIFEGLFKTQMSVVDYLKT